MGFCPGRLPRSRLGCKLPSPEPAFRRVPEFLPLQHAPLRSSTPGLVLALLPLQLRPVTKNPRARRKKNAGKADIQDEPRHWHSGHGHAREPQSALVQHYAGKRLGRLSIEARRGGRFVSHQALACLSDQLASASAARKPVSTGSWPPFLSCTTYAAMAREIASS